jgi:hypothetical protein
VPCGRQPEDSGSVTAAPKHLIAHEYAHHVQNLTGIGPVTHTKAQSLVRSRRSELAGRLPGGGVHGRRLGLAGVRDEDWKDVVDICRRSGDEKVNKERSHGTGKNRVGSSGRRRDSPLPPRPRATPGSRRRPASPDDRADAQV